MIFTCQCGVVHHLSEGPEYGGVGAVAKMLGQHRWTASRKLADLIAAGTLVNLGSDSRPWYRLDDVRAALSQGASK